MHLTYFILVCLLCYVTAFTGDALHGPESTTANEYLKGKWAVFHTLHDVNHDKVLNLEDFELVEEYFEKQDLSPQQLEEVISILGDLWKTVLLGGTSQLSKDEFVEMMKKKYETNLQSFLEEIQNLTKQWSRAVDTNRDNVLSKEEYISNMFAYGHKNMRGDARFYMSHRLIKSRVPVPESSEVWERFLSEKDESKPDIIYAAFKSGDYL